MHEKGLQRQGVGTLVSNWKLRAAVVPLINCSSTGYRVPPSVYIGSLSFVPPKRRSGQLSSMPWRAEWTVVIWANRSVGVSNCLALLRPATPPHATPHRPACGMFGFWNRQVHRISFVRDPEETFKTIVFDALGDKRDGCVLGEPTHRHPILPDPAPPRRPILGSPEPLRPWYVRVLNSTG